MLSQAQNDVTSARGEVTAARAELNALLGVSGRRGAGACPSRSRGPPPPDLAGASAAALTGNAELKVLRAPVDEERARVELAKAMRRPDPCVAGTLTYDAQPASSRSDGALGFAVALPMFTTGRAGRRRRRGHADPRHRRPRRRESRRSTAQSPPPLARAAGAHQALTRYQNDILPATMQVEQMAQESYHSGQTGIAGAAPGGADRARDRACARCRPDSTTSSRWPISSGRWERRCNETSRNRAAALALTAALSRRRARGKTVEEIETTAAAPVKIITLAPATLGGIVAATGVVAAAPGADWVITAPEPARILELPKAEGDRVRTGDLLVRFEIPSATTDVADATGRSRAGAGARRERPGLGRRA